MKHLLGKQSVRDKNTKKVSSVQVGALILHSADEVNGCFYQHFLIISVPNYY
jgi:hypothetical protein